jgi:hypothetical protein
MADAVVETSPARPERSRPRLWYLVMGGATVASIIALVAIAVAHVGTNAPSAPRHAPQLDRRDVLPDARGQGGGKHTAVAHRKTPGSSPLVAVKAPTGDHGPDTQATSRHDVHAESVNHQQSSTNVHDSTNIAINEVHVTSTDRNVSTSSSVRVQNGTVQIVKSGAGTNSVKVSSSVKVSKSEHFSTSAP